MGNAQLQPGAGGAPNAPDAAETEVAGGGPAAGPGAVEPQTVAPHPRAARSRGWHAVVAAPLWPSLCEMDAGLP